MGRQLLLIFLTFLLPGCSRNKVAPTPDDRTFLMGFTPFPYDLSQKALETSFNNTLENGDIVLIHLDHGVPWQEALDNLPFPAEVENTLQSAASIPATHRVLLTATPASPARDSLAGYWNDTGPHQSLPQPWNNYSFDHPQVIAAYINYCRRIIDTVQPDYFAYGIEVNASLLDGTPAFDSFLNLADTVYRTLKQDYPSLPVMLTFQDQAFNKTRSELLQLTSRLLPYTDMMAVSTYPFWLYDRPGQDANPALLPADWLQYMRDLAPGKPFGISETGYIAEDLDLWEIGVQVKGTPAWQADYAGLLLTRARSLNAEFVLWFVYRDYDSLYAHTPDPPFAMKIWKDNGLEDGSGNPRPAHEVWQSWLRKPLAP